MATQLKYYPDQCLILLLLALYSCNHSSNQLKNVSDGGADAAAVDEEAGKTEPKLFDLPSPALGPCAFETAEQDEKSTGNASCPNGIYQGDIEIKQAGQIKTLAGCTRIAGSLTITAPTLTDLSGLESLRVVEGALSVKCPICISGFCTEGVEKLSTFDGLDHLRCVSGDLYLSLYAPQGGKIGGLGELVEVGGSLRAFSELSPVQGIPTFTALRRVWGDILVRDPGCLPALEYAYGYVIIWGPNPPQIANTENRLQDKRSVPSLKYLGCGSTDEPCRDGILGCNFESASQADVNRLSACETGIQGLTIGGADTADLTPLSKLESLRGELIVRNTALRNLDGLDHLQEAASISLQSNSALDALEGLENLKRIDSLTLYENPSLQDVSAINGIELSSIDIEGNRALESLASWSSLKPKAGANGFSIRLVDNSALETLGDWPWLVDVGSVQITGGSLTSLSGLSSLKTAAGISIGGVGTLKSLDGLQALTTVSGRFGLQELPLTDLHGLSGLQSVGEALWLQGMPLLESLDGLTSLKTLGMLDLESCPNLARIAGLETVQHLDLVLDELPALAGLEGLSGLRSAGEFYLYGLDALKNLSGLDQLESADQIIVTACAALTDLQGLGKLGLVSDEVFFSENNSLLDLNGLGALKSVGGAFGISGNPMLASLHALARLTAVGSLSISSNGSLPDCEVAWLEDTVGKANDPNAQPNGGPGACPP